MRKSLVIAVFLTLLAAGLALGIGRDFYSRESAELSGEVLEVIRGDEDYKSHGVRTPRLQVRLADGRTIYVAITEPERFKAGDSVPLSQMAAPWGAVWYKLK
jgi:hypothetical protein